MNWTSVIAPLVVPLEQWMAPPNAPLLLDVQPLPTKEHVDIVPVYPQLIAPPCARAVLLRNEQSSASVEDAEYTAPPESFA
jgi:hypothetical protein